MAVWKGLGDFGFEEAPLYPDSLLELLRNATPPGAGLFQKLQT
jgi:hypothetical protein